VSRTLSFESCSLMLKVFEVDVSEILRWFTLYSTIDRSKMSKKTKINTIEYKIEDNQQYDAMAR
jgi:hypothetical protein